MSIGASFYHGQGFVLGVFLLCACSRMGTDSTPAPPLTSPLSRSVIGYGVIGVSYVHVMDEPDSGGVALGYLRSGSIVQVLERRMVNRGGDTESWVLVEGNYRGWLREGTMQIFENRAKAETAAGFMAE